MTPIKSKLFELLKLEENEWRPVAWSFLYFFCLLGGYYVLRPVRDEMGIQAGLENLPWLFTATFLAMLVAVPVYGWAAGRYPRRTLLPLVYGFFIVNLLVFYLAFTSGAPVSVVARVFFVWLSVFNLFVVSVFWSFMVDIYSREQSKRLFGVVAVGGTVGAIAGPALTAQMASVLGVFNLLPVSVAMLSIALFCVWRLRLWARESTADRTETDALKGNWWDGFTRVFRSRYLLGVSAYILLYTTAATFLYFIQAHIVEGAFEDSADRTRVFALIDLATNSLTVALQLFVTSRIAERWGLAVLLGIVPVGVVFGFLALGWAPVLAVIAAVQVLRRAGNYALARPGREMLFGVLPRVDKYKSKNFVDTVVYRGGDAVSGWVYAGMAALGLGLGGIAWAAVPVALVWLLTGVFLGRRYRALEFKPDPAVQTTS
ncbi:MAG: MFS transporter [Gammaproteobacteria bacterium]|nr:MFS transporter [Gammaproteobacteria bacterium]